MNASCVYTLQNGLCVNVEDCYLMKMANVTSSASPGISNAQYMYGKH